MKRHGVLAKDRPGASPLGRSAPSRLRWLFSLLVIAGLGVAGQGLYIPVKALLAQVLLERAFSQGQIQGRPQLPWPWADMLPIARLSVPRLQVSDIVLSGGSAQALAFGPTLVNRSAAPFSPGTTVLAAHRDTHFAFAKDLKVGDLLLMESLEGRLGTYRITAMQVIHKDALRIPAKDGRNHLVLSTCWPLDAVTSGPLRYVIYAEPVFAPPGQSASTP